MSQYESPVIPAVAISGESERATVRPSWRRTARSVAFAALTLVALVAIADLFFYGRPLGVTIPIFIALLATAISLRHPGYLMTWPGRIIAAALLVVCLTLVEHPSPLRMIMAILGITAIALVSRQDFTASVPEWFVRGSELLSRMAYQLPRDVWRGRQWRRRHGHSINSTSSRLVANWFIPIAISVVFIGLFALANPIIGNWVSSATRSASRFVSDFMSNAPIGRTFFWLIAAFILWALLRSRSRFARRSPLVEAFERPFLTQPLMREGLLVRCLLLFNLIFAVQMGLDLATMLSQGGMLPEGMSYSEYARRGAYPLVATAILAAAFVLIAFPAGPRQAAGVWSRRLVYLWIAQNIVLTATAVWRLSMYVDAFGLTRLRVAAAIWMMLVALGLMWIIWRIVTGKTNAWLIRVNTVTLLATLFLCCFVNFDRIIAWYGVENSYEIRGEGGPKADLAYLNELGIDAIPTLTWLATKLGPEHQTGRRAALLADGLRADLDHQRRSWHGWSLRRQNLAATFRDNPSIQTR